MFKTKIFIICIVLLLACLYVLSIPVVEALTQKEYSQKQSLGNCRIINETLAIDNNYSVAFLRPLNKKYTNLHVVAFGEDNIVYDESRGVIVEKDETLKQYTKRVGFFIYGVVKKDGSFFYSGEKYLSKDYILYIVSSLYYYSYKKAYQIKKYILTIDK